MMGYISIRDMQAKSSTVRRRLQDEGSLVVTSRGKPFALMVSAENKDIEELRLIMRHAKAQLALTRLREQAAANDLNRLTSDEIAVEIAEARNARRQ
jgi:antitoxin (DNA-binding transcriptional repressor) of toxin-antitoxin stability system